MSQNFDVYVFLSSHNICHHNWQQFRKKFGVFVYFDFTREALKINLIKLVYIILLTDVLRSLNVKPISHALLTI